MKKYNFLLLLLFWISLVAKSQENTTDSIHPYSSKKINFAVLPTLSFDRSKGTGLGAIGMGFFQLSDKKGTKPSSVILSGKYTTKKNWNVFAMTQLYFSEDKYRLVTGGGYMNSNFQTYEDIGGGQVEVPYNNHGGFFFIEPSMRVWNKLYIGIGGQIFKSHLDIDSPESEQDSISTSWMNSFATSATFDSKDSPYNPSQGISTSIRVNVFPVWLENVNTFYKLHAEFNYYKRIDHSKILASRASLNAGLGNIPFVAQTYVGGKDIRGYTKGEYRGNETYAIQTELRWNFYRRWGTVGFFGLAMATSPGYVSPLLPGGGAGIRFLVIPKYNINTGIDAAVGKDDWGVYFRITEAF